MYAAFGFDTFFGQERPLINVINVLLGTVSMAKVTNSWRGSGDALKFLCKDFVSLLWTSLSPNLSKGSTNFIRNKGSPHLKRRLLLLLVS